MDFEPTEQQQMIIAQIRRFVHEEIIPLEARLDPDASELPPEDFARLSDKVKEMGFWGLDVPVEFGG
ncbi:MAG: acyl-CoA dehydrogenase family protein, partial [Alphaproteobacteria bacterium]|nr:acyl-CoA dehydrogenase family protein [Alphaproteobacteria bacterium]